MKLNNGDRVTASGKIKTQSGAKVRGKQSRCNIQEVER
ncbi:unnamed protein product [Brassica oleracea]